MLLKADQIRELIELSREDTVVAPSATFPYRISRVVSGYHPNPARAELQATLSLMLEIASSVEAKAR